MIARTGGGGGWVTVKLVANLVLSDWLSKCKNEYAQSLTYKYHKYHKYYIGVTISNFAYTFRI